MTTNSIKTIKIHPHKDWKTELSHSISSTSELLSRLGLNVQDLSERQQAARDFPLKVPESFVARMNYGDPEDPLLTQVLPCATELRDDNAYSPDPLEESKYNQVPGIVHKYRNRVLLIVSPNCAINCRYCFRRHFPYEENRQSKQQWQQALDYIRSREEINEVIYSGGDPLAANDQFLSWLTERIAAIRHIKRLRIHSRLPVVIPSRVDNRLLDWLVGTRFKPIVVLHINHAQEIDQSLQTAAQRLLDQGIQVLNQAVLLRGVNDNAPSLVSLSERLFESGVMPYYLHLLDPVAGASHFDIPEQQAQDLYRQMQAQLPGYLVPKLVRDKPGEPSKTFQAI
jgi:EF-P beta-lysylation protein EpmB